ncbi:MAG TPA: right-handed parallel beta-helix repeat-containing protein [Gaiellaceae bacterium]|nr:right-handed parallel beta-helix repeat-containing protein [Gaiellaceae bacterium]
MTALLAALALAVGSNVVRVPQDAPTVQAAVAAAAAGDTILVDRGTYPGGVGVPKSKPNLTIRGVDRNAVVFDGADTRDDAIDVRADDVTLQNLSAHDFRKNAFYWDGVTGFTGSYLTVWNVLGYGIYAEDSTDGLIEHDYVSGAADAAYYIGECNPCRATIRNVVARLSAVGYSGTNASGALVIRDSRWDRNGAGILPNSFANEADPPQQSALIVGNTVTRSGRARVPLNTPLAGYYGIGIGIAGGNGNRVLRNTISGSRRFGVAVFSTPYEVPGGPSLPASERLWRPKGNSVRANVVGRSGVADLGLSRTAAAGNCFRANRGAKTVPARLQRRPCRSAGGDRRVSRALEASIPAMIEAANAAIRPIPYTAVPAPPPQPNAPG